MDEVVGVLLLREYKEGAIKAVVGNRVTILSR